MRKRKWILPVILAVGLFVLGTYGSAWLLMPSRTEYGATWETYRREPKDSVDVLYFGSSLVYCNVVPSVVWEESGITSYVMAGPEQTVPISYYYIREACRTQDPKAVVLEVTGLFYPQYGSFTKANISYMPWSYNRIAAVLEAAEEELRAGLLFPILDYHSLWTSVGAGQIGQHLDPGTDIFAGYTYLEKIEPQTEIKVRGYRADTEIYADNLEYLRKIYEYCERRGIQLVLMVTPTMGRIADEAYAQMCKDVAELENAVFVGFNENMDALSIDNDTDWYDFIHFNCRGAEKFSRYLAGFLRDELGLSPTEGEDEVLWQARTDEFDRRKNALNE